MRTTGTLSTHITQEVTTLAVLVKMTLADATVIGFTNHDQDIIFDSVTYSAANAYTPTGAKYSDQLNVDNLDIIGLLNSAGITANDILAGVYNDATIEISTINWKSPADGIIKMLKGTIGNITIGDNSYIAEMRNLTQQLQQGIIEHWSVLCRADLGDAARCKVQLVPSLWTATTAMTVRPVGDAGLGSVVRPTTDNGRHFKCIQITGTGLTGGTEPIWDTVIGNPTVDNEVTWEAIQGLSRTDTVASSADKASFVATNLDEADGTVWPLGKVVWLTGANAGREMEVKTWTLSTKTVELYLPMPDTISATETFRIEAGCDKDLLSDCKLTFDNVHNHRGEKYTPNRDQFVSGNK